LRETTESALNEEFLTVWWCYKNFTNPGLQKQINQSLVLQIHNKITTVHMHCIQPAEFDRTSHHQ